jgi:hypothetical protein
MLKLSPKGDIRSCGIIGSSNALVSDTSVTPMDTDANLQDTNVTPQSTDVQPRDSDATTAVHCMAIVPVPEAPKRLKARAISRKKIKLRWLDKSKIEDGFFIERRSKTSGTWERIKKTKSNIKQYIDKGLEPNKLYKYRVCAFNSNGYSAYSKVAKKKTKKQ